MPADPNMLLEIPFFQAMDDQERAAVAAVMGDERFPEGTEIFHEKDQGGILYLIKQGRVRLTVADEGGKELVVDVLDPGEYFGEMSLLDGGNRSTTARSLTDVEAFSLRRSEFLEVLRRQPDAAQDVMISLARRIRKTDDLLRLHMRNPNEVMQEQETLGDRVSDAVAKFGGSWWFIFSFGAFLVIWVLINTKLLLVHNKDGGPFDPYPFILLNLFLSMLAAIQAPVILMSQNRQDAKDRIRSELDYQVDQKAELEILQLHDKLDSLGKELLRRLPRK